MKLIGYKIFLSQADKADLPEPTGKPDTVMLADAIRHLLADYRNAVWVDGNFVYAKWLTVDNVEVDKKLVVNGVLTSYDDLRDLIKSHEWPEEP